MVTRHCGDHFEMYRNIKSQCCRTGTNIVLCFRVIILQKQTNNLIEKEIRFVVTRGGEMGGGGIG